METNLYHLVYCSRNRIRGNNEEVAAEIRSILTSARCNNPRLGVTGALLYNSGNFAQVLEGPLPSIASIFETIQRDPRHSEVTVVQNGMSSKRDFPDWSMAFVGGSADSEMPRATAAFDAVFAHSVGAGEQMLSVLRDLILREDDWLLRDVA